MLSACWLIGAYFLAVSSHKRGRLNTSVYSMGTSGGSGLCGVCRGRGASKDLEGENER